MDSFWKKDFICGDDGYYIFWPEGWDQGGYAAHNLRQIADDLDKVNEPWEKSLQEYFNNEIVR